MKLAIIVGHNAQAQGAIRRDTGETEFRFNSRIAAHMHAIQEKRPVPGLELRTFYRKPGGGYRREIAEVYDAADQWGAHATIELHFNAAADASATGTEVLSSGTPRSLALAQCVQNEVVSMLGLRDRGVRTRARSDRGGGSLFAGRAPAILVEPFFGSSKIGLAATDERDEEIQLAAAYLIGAVRALRAFPRSDLGESRTLRDAGRAKIATAATAGAVAVPDIIASLPQARQAIEDATGLLEVAQGLVGEYWQAAIVLSGGLFVWWMLGRVEYFRREDWRKMGPFLREVFLPAGGADLDG